MINTWEWSCVRLWIVYFTVLTPDIYQISISVTINRFFLKKREYSIIDAVFFINKTICQDSLVSFCWDAVWWGGGHAVNRNIQTSLFKIGSWSCIHSNTFFIHWFVIYPFIDPSFFIYRIHSFIDPNLSIPWSHDPCFFHS